LFNQLRQGAIQRYQREKRYVHKDGRLVWAQSHASAVRGGDGELRFIISIVEDITERKQMEKEILETIANERRRIGHELHDSLCQYLAGITYRAKAFEQALAAKSQPEATEAAELVGLLQKAISQTRSLARGFDPIEVESIGLPAALQNLSAETENFFGITCTFRGDDVRLDLEPQRALSLYRIAQEAIHNAIKHGEASRVQMQLSLHARSLCLRIEDDGLGFDPGKHSDTGMGLRVMQYRARSIGGNLKIHSQLKHGTQIQCILPYFRPVNGD
jgi:signal transduction histidine kinase